MMLDRQPFFFGQPNAIYTWAKHRTKTCLAVLAFSFSCAFTFCKVLRFGFIHQLVQPAALP